MTLFTIGHSNHPLQRLVDLLAEHGIGILVDTRSQPYSRFVPHFNQRPLRQSLESRGIRYVYLGRELGGKQSRPDPNLFEAGILQLLEHAKAANTAILCAEENPENCHRKHLIAPALLTRDVEVLHIRGDGRVEWHLAQPALF